MGLRAIPCEHSSHHVACAGRKLMRGRQTGAIRTRNVQGLAGYPLVVQEPCELEPL